MLGVPRLPFTGVECARSNPRRRTASRKARAAPPWIERADPEHPGDDRTSFWIARADADDPTPQELDPGASRQALGAPLNTTNGPETTGDDPRVGDTSAMSVRHSLLSLYRVCSPAERRRARFSVVAAIGVASLDLMGLVLFVPLMSLLVDPDNPTSFASDIGELLGTSTDRLTLWLAIGVGALFLLRAVSALAYQWWASGFVHQLQVDIAGRLIRSYLSAPYSFHLDHSSAELVRNVRDNTVQGISGGLLAFTVVMVESFTLAATATFLLLVDPVIMALVAVYFAAVVWIYQRIIRPKIQRRVERLQELIVLQYRVLSHSFAGVKQIYASRRQDFFERELVRVGEDMAVERRQLAVFAQFPKYYLEGAVLLGLATASAALFASRPRESALTAIGVLAAAGFRAMPSLVRLTGSMQTLVETLPPTQTVLADLNRFSRREPTEQQIDFDATDQIMELRDVCFEYPTGGEVLIDVSVGLKRGESLGIVGLSGAGKSTLLDIILGLQEPTRGAIRIGDDAFDDVTEAWLDAIGFVAQDIYILEAPIRDNVAFGLDAGSIDDARVWLALEKAELADVIRRLPNGLDEEIGERGVRLSGGQRQRLGIARALYREPQVLILDEATSSLDVETEARITETVQKLAGSVTVIVVTHRISTIKPCDRILVLSEGRVAGLGSFSSLADNEIMERLVALSSMTEPQPPEPPTDHGAGIG